MGRYDFETDLIISSRTENEISKLIKSRNPNIADININNDGRYDLEVVLKDGDLKYIEIKEDFMCAKTGNIAIEYRCRGKTSGISTTKADIWIYKVHTKNGHELYGIDIDDLRKSINRSEFFRKVTGGDPGSNTMMYLYKYDKFKNMCRRL